MYKTLGFKWLNQAFCPASAFVSVDKNEARNPQRFIHVSVMGNTKRRCMKQTFKILVLVILTVIQSCGQKNSTDNTVKTEPVIDIFEKYSNDSIRDRIFKIAYENASTAPSYIVFIAEDLNTGTRKEICCEAPFLSGAMHRELKKGYDEIGSKFINSLILEPNSSNECNFLRG